MFHAGIGDMAAYGITKAAAVMVATKWANKLKDDGFVVVSLAPGLVDTTGTIGESGMYSVVYDALICRVLMF